MPRPPKRTIDRASALRSEMSEPAGAYIPRDLRSEYRKQAVRVWSITAVIVGVWVGLILGAPLLAGGDVTTVSSAVYGFFSYICHQLTDRSLHVAGHQMAVCSRCFGVYAGLLAGILVYPLWRNVDEIESIPRLWLFLSIIPISIDWGLTVFGVWENTHVSRFVTGAILGIACGTFIMPALVDITRNLSSRRGARAMAR